MFFPDDWLEEVRRRNDIVEVISETVQLEARGRKYIGLCPFHKEKTGSFSVDPEKQFFYCFGCHKGGDVFRFVMGIENVSFPDSVQALAERAKLPLPQQTANPQNREYREKLQQAATDAARFFRDQLHTEAGRGALEYLHNRGLTDTIIRRFGLGYAPDEWSRLRDHLESKGFRRQELVDAGLMVEKEAGSGYDRFRGRIMFPIFDLYGKVIAFGGRVMGDGQPKYLNSSEGQLYSKSRHLYGMQVVRKAGRQSTLVVVEGYMDVIALHQFGFTNVVASLGTALTPEQAKLLKRYAQEVLICYDGDAAGQRATLRGLEILRQEGCNVRVVALPGGMDPDELVRQEGTKALEEAFRIAPSLTAFLLAEARKGKDLSQPEQRTQYAIAAAYIVGRLEDPLEREMYLKELQVQTGFTLEALTDQMSRAQRAENRTRMRNEPMQNEIFGNSSDDNRDTTTKPSSAIVLPKAVREAECTLLSAGLQLGWGTVTRIIPGMIGDDFNDAFHRDLYEKTLAAPVTAGLLSEYEDEEAGRVAAILSTELPDEKRGEMLRGCIETMRWYKLEREIRELTEALRTPMDRDARVELTVRLTEKQQAAKKLSGGRL